MSINFVNFFWQCVAMTAWVFIVAAIYIVCEHFVRWLDDHTQTLATSYLLWLALGWAGAHHIYNNRISTGLALLAAARRSSTIACGWIFSWM